MRSIDNKPRERRVLKSIYSKMFFSIVAILFLCFVAFGLLLFNLINSYVVEDKEKQLYNNAWKISEMTTIYLENNSRANETMYKKNLNIFNDGPSSDIIVIDNQNKILYTTIKNNEKLKNFEIPSQYTNDIYSGNTYKGTGKFEGLYEQDTFVVGVPVFGENDQVAGGVYIASNVPLNSFINNIKGYYLTAAVIMLFICFMATYAMARKMIRPLQRMSVAVKQFAMGNFDVRVPVTSDDEFGELATAFNNMAASVNSLDKMRNDFIANVSHDLRTPMTVIAGFIDGILDNTIEKEKQHEYLVIIRDEILRLSRLVKNLLDIAKIEAGELTLNVVEFNICEMMSKILISFESVIEKKNVDVEVDFLSPQINVLADYDSVFQVIYNLCDNAVKFTNEGGYIKITMMEQNNKAHIVIKNSGPGMNSEEMSRLFEKFYKSDRSRSMDKKGTGLGLYISKNIINRHGENITAKSVEGEYTEFSFDLPLAKK